MPQAPFHKPDSLDEALTLLDGAQGAHCLSGGATLVAMINAELVTPDAIVSLRDIEALRGAERLGDGSIRIGAMRRHRETAFETDLRDGQAVVSSAASQIANPPVRNMGTIGGSIAFADPAADYPPALVAADAVVELSSVRGVREVAAADYFVGWYETALQDGELIAAVRIPAAPMGSIGIYHKLARISGDFATVSVALVLGMEKDACAHISIAIGACGPTPVRLSEIEQTLIGGNLEESAVRAAASRYVEALDPVDDVRASADYRRAVAPRMISHAIATARDAQLRSA